MTTSNISHHVWVLDTGATNHMCCSLSHMHDLKTLSTPITVNFPNGNTALVTQIGSVLIQPISIVLSDVLYIPSFSFNLISISKLSAELNAPIYFTSNECIVQDQHQKKGWVLGKHLDGLYQFQNTPSHINVLAATKKSSHLWHNRLGHVPIPALHKISELHVSTIEELQCQLCPLAKQCNLPFSSSTSNAQAAFDLIHCDVWSPYKTPTTDGCKFFLTIVLF